MAKLEMEFFDVEVNLNWRQVEDVEDGIMEKILSYDDETGDYTRLLKYPPMETHQRLTHDFWEEVYILKGGMYDRTNKQNYLEGYYACCPPGMPHGPFDIPNGCTMIEMRYYKKG